VLVRARDVERTVGAKFMLTRSVEAFAMMCPTLLLRLLNFDVALDLLKRHSGIVWGPGRFAGLLRGGDVRRLGILGGALFY